MADPSFAPLSTCTPESTGDIDLGSGWEQFEAVGEDHELLLTPGFQGGYHVFGSVRANDADPVGVRMDFLLCQQGQRVGQRLPFTVDLARQKDMLGYVGVTVILNDNLGPAQVQDRETTMAVQLVERSGRRSTDTVSFIVRCCDELL